MCLKTSCNFQTPVISVVYCVILKIEMKMNRGKDFHFLVKKPFCKRVILTNKGFDFFSNSNSMALLKDFIIVF